MTRLGIAVPFIEPGRAGGGDWSTAALLRGLDRTVADESLDVRVGCGSANEAWVADLDLRNIPSLVVGKTPRSDYLSRGATLILRARLRTNISRALEREFSAIHFPLLPATPFGSTPSAATIWDLQHRDLPRNYSVFTRVYRRGAYEAVARTADLVFAPTSFTAERICSLIPKRRAEVRLVTPGVIDRDAPVDDAGALRCLEALGRDRPYVYYPAAWWPHKNHATLFEALRHLPDEMPCVLSGGGRHARRGAARLARRHGVADRVLHVGYVSLPVLRALYRRARVMVYPSSYEGFGMPPLEAMAQDTPVVTSELPVLQEVAGDAALRVDPRSATQLAEAIESLVPDSAFRDQQIARGRDRCEIYSAEAGARRHIEEYRRLLA